MQQHDESKSRAEIEHPHAKSASTRLRPLTQMSPRASSDLQSVTTRGAPTLLIMASISPHASAAGAGHALAGRRSSAKATRSEATTIAAAATVSSGHLASTTEPSMNHRSSLRAKSRKSVSHRSSTQETRGGGTTRIASKARVHSNRVLPSSRCWSKPRTLASGSAQPSAGRVAGHSADAAACFQQRDKADSRSRHSTC